MNKSKSVNWRRCQKIKIATTVYTKLQKRTRVYERHLSAGIRRQAFEDRSEWKIDTFTFNMIRHLTADINKRQGLRIDAKP